MMPAGATSCPVSNAGRIKASRAEIRTSRPDDAKGMKRFKSARQLQRFVSIHDPIANLFHFPRNTLSSAQHRDLRNAAMQIWNKIACVAAA